MTTPLTVSRREAAVMLGVGVKLLDRLNIPHVELGNGHRYRVATLEAFLKKREGVPAPTPRRKRGCSTGGKAPHTGTTSSGTTVVDMREARKQLTAAKRDA